MSSNKQRNIYAQQLKELRMKKCPYSVKIAMIEGFL